MVLLRGGVDADFELGLLRVILLPVTPSPCMVHYLLLLSNNE
jgi:hypothetical protein